VVDGRRGADAVGELAALGVEYVEQRPARVTAGAPSCGGGLPIPVYVDEIATHSLTSPRQAAHGINIAREVGRYPRGDPHGTPRGRSASAMLGCMVESGLGTLAAAVALLCDHVDLDGNLLLAHDPAPGPSFVDGIQVASEEPGLGCG
jgi:hypothetical protein